MSDVVAFTVYGTAESGGSKRALPAGGRPGGRPIIVDDNPKAKQWRGTVAVFAGEAMQGRAPLDGPLRLMVRFHVKRPTGHFTSTGALSAEGRRRPYPDKRPDLTKLLRPVEDALTAIVWRDDDQVVQQDVEKLYAGRDEPTRTEIEVTPARPLRPYDGHAQLRLDRLEQAIGPDLSSGVYRDEQVRATLRLIRGEEHCPCGALVDPLGRWCAKCGRATFSEYARPAKRAAGVPLEPVSPQIAGTA